MYLFLLGKTRAVHTKSETGRTYEMIITYDSKITKVVLFLVALIIFFSFSISFFTFTTTTTTRAQLMNERKRKKNTKTEDFKIGFDDSILKMIGTNDREDNKLKIALITCEFNGPTQNGGIGTQFTALAKVYAKAGHEVTVLFTEGERVRGNERGRKFENWVKFYKTEHNVELIGLYRDQTKTYIGRHLLESYEVYKFMKTNEHRFDVAHFHEYRGAAYYTLLAKTQALFLRNLLVIVQTHGNNKWAKVVGNGEILGDVGELEMDFMERRTVKLADFVVSPSRYLLEWMRRENWAECENESIVHPNLLPEEARLINETMFKNDDVDANNNGNDSGSRDSVDNDSNSNRGKMDVDELVFFGRLETRKGVVEFCDAIDILLLEDDEKNRNNNIASKISKITFLGRPASVLGQNGHEYVQNRAKKWTNKPWRIETRFGSEEAKAYLMNTRKTKKLAVLPSLIENSPYAVYECAELGIPFIASDVGGTRDLLKLEDRALSLIGYSEEETYHEKMNMTGELLAMKIRDVLENGAFSARPRYDAKENEEKWLRWTTQVVTDFKTKRREHQSAASNFKDEIYDENELPFVSIVMTHYERPRLCKFAIQSVIDQDYPKNKFEFILVDDKSPSKEAQDFLDTLEDDFKERNWKIVRNAENLYLGGARNVGFKHAKGKYVMFMDDDNYAKPFELRTFVVAMEHGNADILTSLVQFFWSEDNPLRAKEIVDDEPSYLFLGGDGETGAFKNCFGDANCCVRASSFEKIGGYTEDKQIGFEDWEMYANASIRGFRVDIVPESIYYYRFSRGSMQRTTDYLINRKRSLRPYLKTLPKSAHASLLKAAFPRQPKKSSSKSSAAATFAKPSGMMRQGDARFHGIDEDSFVAGTGTASFSEQRREENFGRIEL